MTICYSSRVYSCEYKLALNNNLLTGKIVNIATFDAIKKRFSQKLDNLYYIIIINKYCLFFTDLNGNIGRNK